MSRMTFAHTIKVKCVICNKDFIKRTRAVTGRRGIIIRPTYAVTCSHACSRARLRGIKR